MLIVVLFSPAYATHGISLSTDQDIATAGYYQLHWQADLPLDTIYIVEETSSNAAQAQRIYTGADTATVISGKPDGQYTYIVRTENEKHISKPLHIQVKHHSLTTALVFFIVGCVVFLSILIAILVGNRTANQ